MLATSVAFVFFVFSPACGLFAWPGLWACLLLWLVAACIFIVVALASLVGFNKMTYLPKKKFVREIGRKCSGVLNLWNKSVEGGV